MVQKKVILRLLDVLEEGEVVKDIDWPDLVEYFKLVLYEMQRVPGDGRLERVEAIHHDVLDDSIFYLDNETPTVLMVGDFMMPLTEPTYSARERLDQYLTYFGTILETIKHKRSLIRLCSQILPPTMVYPEPRELRLGSYASHFPKLEFSYCYWKVCGENRIAAIIGTNPNGDLLINFLNDWHHIPASMRESFEKVRGEIFMEPSTEDIPPWI